MSHRSEKPENQSDDEDEHSDCPHNRNTRDEANDEKNYSEKNHDASSDSTNFSCCQPPRCRRFKKREVERRG
jgi:hypothetical protein